ncbi:hypothetical protein POTOM_012651 [Populus tomentosa]|uniref:Uncharacterized protein n=1 Tax=Populus tomentosa TaxID=118781 RepID=A0A8X8AAT9_POPTO|nr:hypothetical protein POTOM_012651 [Populus tomentosa]
MGNPEQYCDDLLPTEILSRKYSSNSAQCDHQRSQLSRRAHFDRLVELASSTAARLVNVIECSNQNDHNVDYCDAGNVPELNIDTTKPFHAAVFITGMLKAAALI